MDVDLNVVAAFDHRLAGDHLGHDQTEGVDVGREAHLLAARLFGRDVAGRSEHRARFGEAAVEACGRLGEAKIEDLGHLSEHAPRQEDVLGLDVAVGDAHAVGLLEGTQHLNRDFSDLLERHGALVESFLERPAFEQGEDEVGATIRGTPVVLEADDVGVLELAEDLGFPGEALALGVSLEMRFVHQLEGHHLPHVLQLGAVDGGAAAHAEGVDDLIAADLGPGGQVSGVHVEPHGTVSAPARLPRGGLLAAMGYAHARMAASPGSADDPYASGQTVAVNPDEGSGDSWAQAEAQLTAAWDVRGIDVADVPFIEATAVLKSHERPISARSAVDTLPTLLRGGDEREHPQIVMGDLLGEGGMGVVRIAEQPALDREVAVKTLRGDRPASAYGPQLLREARVTGILEHPNVVPVYALGRDEVGGPLLVMKKITGHSWQEVLDASADARGQDAYLREQLGILIQVAKATHYAHDKGIIHRDLKPDNVMLGAYGEVYVVDWGIAVGTSNCAVRGAPMANDVNCIEGTPAFMAPEMAAGMGEILEPRTDVYLLGAVLHLILTGEAPHEKNSLVASLTSSYRSAPRDYPDWVPRDLVNICHRAMAQQIEDRFESAAVLAEALEEFLVHMTSLRMSDEAAAHFGELQDELTTDGDDDKEQVYARFRECTFGFRQALKAWPGNEAARTGLQDSLEAMIDFELARGAPRAAVRLVDELPEPAPEVKARVDRAVEQWRNRQDALTSLERETDLSGTTALRSTIMLVTGVMWVLGCLGAGYLHRNGLADVTPTRFAGVNFTIALMLTVSTAIKRDEILVNRANRRVVATAILGFTAYTFLWLLAGHLGVSVAGTVALHSTAGAALWASGGLNVDRRWMVVAVGAAISAVFALLVPDYAFEGLGITGGLSTNLSRGRWLSEDGDASGLAS